MFISGRGTNLAALIAAARDPRYPAEISLVFSNVADAPGLQLAAGATIPVKVLSHREFAERHEHETEIASILEAEDIELICLAGYMRLLTAEFVNTWQDRMINIHPSLLPAFPGLDTHERALAAGVRIHGATVHFVRAEMDTGPIVIQAAVAVRDDDTPASLGERVLAMEHEIYPRALDWLARGRLRIVRNRVVFAGAGVEQSEPVLVSPDTSITDGRT